MDEQPKQQAAPEPDAGEQAIQRNETNEQLKQQASPSRGVGSQRCRPRGWCPWLKQQASPFRDVCWDYGVAVLITGAAVVHAIATSRQLPTPLFLTPLATSVGAVWALFASIGVDASWRTSLLNVLNKGVVRVLAGVGAALLIGVDSLAIYKNGRAVLVFCMQEEATLMIGGRSAQCGAWFWTPDDSIVDYRAGRLESRCKLPPSEESLVLELDAPQVPHWTWKCDPSTPSPEAPVRCTIAVRVAEVGVTKGWQEAILSTPGGGSGHDEEQFEVSLAEDWRGSLELFSPPTTLVVSEPAGQDQIYRALVHDEAFSGAQQPCDVSFAY